MCFQKVRRRVWLETNTFEKNSHFVPELQGTEVGSGEWHSPPGKPPKSVPFITSLQGFGAPSPLADIKKQQGCEEANGARGWESVPHRSLWGQSPGLSAGPEEGTEGGGTRRGGDQQGTRDTKGDSWDHRQGGHSQWGDTEGQAGREPKTAETRRW